MENAMPDLKIIEVLFLFVALVSLAIVMGHLDGRS
jgi:hypothetical protein